MTKGRLVLDQIEERTIGGDIELLNKAKGIDPTIPAHLSTKNYVDTQGFLTEAETDARYFQQTEFINTSVGAPDAAKPVVLDGAGKIDETMVNDADIDHTQIANISIELDVFLP